MVCKICENSNNNRDLELTEMMYGMRDKFLYFECAICECIQIDQIPGDMSVYYPADYYSLNVNTDLTRKSWFNRLQLKAVVNNRSGLYNKLITFKYRHPEWWSFLAGMGIADFSASILDIGSGTGELLKKLYSIGFSDLTGADPYITADIAYNKKFRIKKSSVFEINGLYQAIMLHHSMEHMDDQDAILQKIHSLLSDNGRLLLRIPVVSKQLMNEYGTNVVSLDAPRHFFIHSLKSIEMLMDRNGFVIEKKEFDATEFSFWASEQYKNNISLHNDLESFLVKKTFSTNQLIGWKKRIADLNASGESDNLVLFAYKK